MLSIGSDPEFAIFKNNEIISAQKVFGCLNCNPCADCGENCGGDPPCDYCCSCDTMEELYNTDIGVDGGEILGELRPGYAMEPLTHFKNIKHLVKLLPKEYEIKAGTIQKGECLGGHIHFGFDEMIDCEEMAKYLSYYSGILLRKIEKKEDVEKRDSIGYGWFGSWDFPEWAEENGIEWRMPASWLVTPEITKGALCLSYVVANEFLLNPETIPLCKTIKILDPKTFQQRYLNLLNGKAGKIIRKVEDMELFSKYKKEIGFIINMVVNDEKWESERNILESW